jgi:Flp pilus assembly protein TadD
LNGWVKTHSDDVPGFQMLASLAITSNQFGDARRWLELVLAAQPDNAIALNNLAWVALAEGDAVRARALAQRAYFIAPGPQTQDTLGWIIARQGDSATAVALLQQAASLRPSSTILYHEGFALNAVGRPDDARAALDRALGDSKPFDGRAEAVVLRRQLGQK